MADQTAALPPARIGSGMSGLYRISGNECEAEESLPPSSTVSFLHAVGQSTLRQGFAVPVVAQISWLAEVKKGEKAAVRINFGDGQSVLAALRRLNNARGHLQFRYESREQAALRGFLAQVFRAKANCKNALLKVTEIRPREFLFEPVSSGSQKRACLSICQPHFHNCFREETEVLSEYKELLECFRAIQYDENKSQNDYNKIIAATLHSKSWQGETRILKEIGLRCDFEKNGVWVEVEFGNARVYYQDYIKFLLASRYRGARLGILLCPTNAFAQLLCDLGQRRAVARRGSGAKRPPTYSGMMSLEKAMRELPYLQFLLTSRTVIAGIEVQGAE
jgi:hypothetical protein